LTALSVGPGPAESAIGLMEKIPHRDDIQVRPYITIRRAGFYAVRNAPSDFKLITSAAGLSSSNGVEDASSGRYLTPVRT
jgi:hypothetical protein